MHEVTIIIHGRRKIQARATPSKPDGMIKIRYETGNKKVQARALPWHRGVLEGNWRDSMLVVTQQGYILTFWRNPYTRLRDQAVVSLQRKVASSAILEQVTRKQQCLEPGQDTVQSARHYLTTPPIHPLHLPTSALNNALSVIPHTTLGGLTSQSRPVSSTPRFSRTIVPQYAKTLRWRMQTSLGTCY